MARAEGRRRRSGARGHALLLALAALCLVGGYASEVVVRTAAVAASAAPQTAPRPAVTPVQPPGVVEVLGGVVAPTRAYPGLALPTREPGPPVVVDAPYGVAPASSPRPDACGSYGSPRQITPGITVLGGGAVSASWQADIRPSVLSYRVTAIDQQLVGGDQPAPPVVTAAQPAGCTQVSVTMGGLVPGNAYVFWLEEEVVDRADPTLTRFHQVGWTDAVVVVG